MRRGGDQQLVADLDEGIAVAGSTGLPNSRRQRRELEGSGVNGPGRCPVW
jgi:hypothetical protein